MQKEAFLKLAPEMVTAFNSDDAEEILRLYPHIEKLKNLDESTYVLYEQINFYLAEYFYKKEDFEESKEFYLRVSSRLGTSLHNEAKIRLAWIYLREGESCFEEILEILKDVRRVKPKENFAYAQSIMAYIYSVTQRKQEAIKLYNRIKRTDDNISFALAQWSLFELTYKRKYLERIELNDDLEIYSYAQYTLALKSMGGLRALESLENIPETSNFYLERAYEIDMLKMIYSLENYEYNFNFLDIFKIVKEILNRLFITSKYENNIAHYTNLTVSKLLLSKAEEYSDFELKSPLRLNTVNLMNDPEEGVLLNQVLNLEVKVQTKDLAFISCFTLHHDSLNQFRLYAKEKQQEATGLSLVLNRDFFIRKLDVSRMLHKFDGLIRQNIDKNYNKPNSEAEKKLLSPMPLYRCIYLDPTSGLIKVAQREGWSFHREYKKENKECMLDSNPEAEMYWKEYQNEIQKLEAEVNSHLKALVEQVKLLNSTQLSDEEKELLAEILLPLRYLIKHMAFKEEQECRMIYVTQMDNPLIKYDEKINRIYIDYEPSVMEHLEKIYLAPKAKDEKMVFEYLCSRGQEVRKGKPPVKVKISQNPFR